MSSSTAQAAGRGADQPAIKENLITGLLGLAMVLVIMNTMMFNLALPDVAREFALSPSSTSWIVTGYSIVFAISSITFSRLSDFIPLRRLFIIGLLLLSLAAIVGFFTGNFLSLLFVRLLQASGAGAVPALSLVFISRYIPLARRGKSMALISAAVSLGLGLGPVAGGAIVEYLGWHVLFAVTAVTLLLVPVFAKILPQEMPSKGSFDALGALLIGLGATGLLLSLTSKSIIALLAGLIALAFFIVHITKARSPFVQPALFSNRPYLMIGTVGIIAYLCSFATLFLMPQILVHVYGLTASQSGFVIFPGSLLSFLLSRKVGKIIDKSGNASIIRFVPLLVMLSMLLFALLSGTSYIAILLIYMLLSVCFTFLNSSISNEMSRILNPSEIGSGLGLFQLLQFFSGAFGVAVSASALSWQKGLSLTAAFSNIYWGLAVLVVLAIFCAQRYVRNAARSK